jgi:acetyl esterase/lipase
VKPWILAAGALAVAFVLSACSSLVFTAANAPARFGDFQRYADLAFGENPRQRLDVYSPPRARDGADRGARHRPIIVFWYGGSWERGRKEQYRFVGAALAQAGYVAVLPDYRLYPEARFPAFMDDAAAALAWVVAHAAEFGGDPARIFLAGHSAGAQIAGLLAYDSARQRNAGLSPDTVKGFIGLSGPYALDPDTEVLRTIFAAPYGFDDWQPVRKVTASSPPALLVHGESDDVVRVAHTRAMADALEAAGVPVTLRIYAGRGHADTVAPFAKLAPRKLPVLEEIGKFVGGEMPGGVTAGH